MVQITETILRDAHQSLLATRMKLEDMLPIAEKLDKVGYFSLEMWGGATFDVCIRFLNEDPWERLRILKSKIKNTKLQMLLRGQNLVGYRHYADDLVEKFVKKSAENGIDVFRIFDALNDIRNMEYAISVAKDVNATVEGTISYTVSPVHTISQFLKLAEELAKLSCDIICIKDMAGFMSPKEAYDLIVALKKEIGLPVHLHTHCSSGMAPATYFAACQAGVDILDTAMSPLAWGTSQPPTESIAGMLKNTPYDTGFDMALLSEIRDYFFKVKENYKDIIDPISERVDTSILIHQIPGGMLSNLISQLKQQKAMDKYQDVLKETAYVRADLGYPPLVTPTSQIVGTQAVFNVVLGERYKMISKEVKEYIKGMYGKPPGEISLEVKKLAIGDEEPITCRPGDLISPEWEKNVKELTDTGLKSVPTDEDILSYALFPQPAMQFFKKQKGESQKVEPGLKAASSKLAGQTFNLVIDGEKYEVIIEDPKSQNKLMPPFKVMVNDEEYKVQNLDFLKTDARNSPSETQMKLNISSLETVGGNVYSPMPGSIVDIKVKIKDKVEKGSVMLILEAMKMQNEIQAPVTGTVEDIYVKVGTIVEGGDLLLKIMN